MDSTTKTRRTENMATINRLIKKSNFPLIRELSVLNALMSICFLDWLWVWSVIELRSLPPLAIISGWFRLFS